jgi:Fe-S-cluster containining protein
MKEVLSLKEYISKYNTEKLSDYCLNSCEKPCCEFSEKWPLSIQEKELPLLFSLDQIVEFELAGKLTDDDNYRDAKFFTGGNCPHYESESHKCTKHNKKRPKVCSEYPINYSRKKGLILRATCGYVRENWEEMVKEFLDQDFIELQRSEPIFIEVPIGNRAYYKDALREKRDIRHGLSFSDSNSTTNEETS